MQWLKLALISLLARSAGPEGMVGGQVADIEGEGKSLSLSELEYIHLHKTGKLLLYSVISGALIANAEEKELEELEAFAKHLGIAFQIRDDILDVEGDAELIGKPLGSDEEKYKSTYPSLLTMDGAKKALNEHYDACLYHLEQTSLKTDLLKEIASLIVERKF